MLKPAPRTERYFILAGFSSTNAAAATAQSPGGASAISPLGVGVGQVKLPAYLLNNALAVRKAPNEIDYLESALWAERLDKGMQRVLADNLGSLLATDQIRLSSWQRQDVAVEVHVVLDRFDVDLNGLGKLEAWWRILTPGGERTLKAGECSVSLQGPAPGTNPLGAIDTLSQLVGKLSVELAGAVRQSATR